MLRPTRPSGLVLLALLLASCSHTAEQIVLKQFFELSRLRDRTALGAMATVIFEPAADGTVTTFIITSVDPEERQPLDDAPTPARIAALSLPNLTASKEPGRAGGQMISKTVRVSAPVRLPDGRTVRKTVSIVLARATVVREQEIYGRWIVTGFTTYAQPSASVNR